MIPILYEKDETAFVYNGLGRLRDAISVVVTEGRNDVYECDFEYPVSGANADLIQIGRIIGVTHDETGDIQPFDIVSYEKPIDGIVTWHCVHISYRQSYITATGSNINSLADAFTLLGNGVPSNPFTYTTDKTSSGYFAAADGLPHSVREMLGGMEGSILDAYGGEYEWDKFEVKLHDTRGRATDFSIRYGVNMTDFNDSADSEGHYSACVPYWTDGTNKVVGSMVSASGTTITGRGECVPLDVSEKFESQPTKAQVEAAGVSYMNSNNTYAVGQNITVEFVRLQDVGEFQTLQTLMQCRLCDTVTVIFPDYNMQGTFKIVKTVWDVLQGRYESMELGTLSMSLAEALNISTGSGTSYSGGGGGTSDYTQLSNKPQINSVTLTGNKSLSDLGINIPTITDTYSGTSSDGMSGKAVKSAIDALDGTISGAAGAGKTLTAFSQTDGKVNATFGNISITKSQVSDFPTLATVATSGDYDDLTDKPTIPTVNDATLTIQKNGSTVKTFTANASSNVTANITVPTKVSDLSNDSNFVPASSLAAVATSGDYDDLTDKPTIPTVNDATLTIQKNGTDVQTFTANASSNATANITVPTNVSELSNDSGFITSPNVVYCASTTAAATKAKVAGILSGTLTTLTEGTQAIVKFYYANSVASPTLKIGDTAAKSIKRYGTTAPSTSAASSWQAGSCVLFVYDGNYWQMTGWLNSTYSVISAVNIMNASGTTAGLITGQRAASAVSAHESVSDVKVNGTSVLSGKYANITVPTETATTPLMDGAAAVGSETTWAKGDHVHPSDTSKQDTLVSGTNIKTINNTSLLGSGNISISGGGGTSDYDQLSNRPQINSVTLTGNKASADINVVDMTAPMLTLDTSAQSGTTDGDLYAAITALSWETDVIV